MNPSYPIEVNLDFTKLEIHEDCIISTVQEGVVFDTSELKQIHTIFDSYFQGKSFGFISNRENDYTIIPTCFINNSKNNGLLGVAILCYSKASFDNSLFVKKFYTKPYQVFYTLEECKKWFNSLKLKKADL